MQNTIYTRDEAALIVELFEDVLQKYNILVPSPEDDERDEDNTVSLYGMTYSELLDNVETRLQDLLARHYPNTEVIEYVFSGTV